MTPRRLTDWFQHFRVLYYLQFNPEGEGSWCCEILQSMYHTTPCQNQTDHSMNLFHFLCDSQVRQWQTRTSSLVRQCDAWTSSLARQWHTRTSSLVRQCDAWTSSLVSDTPKPVHWSGSVALEPVHWSDSDTPEPVHSSGSVTLEPVHWSDSDTPEPVQVRQCEAWTSSLARQWHTRTSSMIRQRPAWTNFSHFPGPHRFMVPFLHPRRPTTACK